jgi:DNA-binding CsgD family transcriptional regulator
LLIESVRRVHAGELWLDSHTTAAVIRRFVANEEAPPPPQIPSQAVARSPLSLREAEIVTLVAQGFKNKEMAEKMLISEQTVKNHLHNIFDKLDVSDRLELDEQDSTGADVHCKRQRYRMCLVAGSVNRSDVDDLFPGRVRKTSPRKTEQTKVQSGSTQSSCSCRLPRRLMVSYRAPRQIVNSFQQNNVRLATANQRQGAHIQFKGSTIQGARQGPSAIASATGAIR